MVEPLSKLLDLLRRSVGGRFGRRNATATRMGMYAEPVISRVLGCGAEAQKRARYVSNEAEAQNYGAWHSPQLGENFPPNYFQDCMFFLMVPALRPLATGSLAIWFAYQVSGMFGRFLTSSRYAFCQPLYIACVSTLRASRLALLGV